MDNGALDHLINEKVAASMKKGVKLILDRFDDMYQQKMKIMVRAEINRRIQEVRDAL